MDTAVGAISIWRDKLATMLSACTYWQQFDGQAWTAAQALERIYQDTSPLLDDLLQNPANRPYAIIHKGTSGLHWSGASAPRLYTVRGTLIIEFHRTPPTLKADDPGDSEREYENAIGRIIASYDANNPGLLELSALGDYLQITGLREDGPYRVDPTEVPMAGDVQVYFLEIDFGNGV